MTDSLSAANYFHIKNMKSKGLKKILMSIPRRQSRLCRVSLISIASEILIPETKKSLPTKITLQALLPGSKKVLCPFSKSVTGKLYWSVKETTKMQ